MAPHALGTFCLLALLGANTTVFASQLYLPGSNASAGAVATYRRLAATPTPVHMLTLPEANATSQLLATARRLLSTASNAQQGTSQLLASARWLCNSARGLVLPGMAGSNWTKLSVARRLHAADALSTWSRNGLTLPGPDNATSHQLASARRVRTAGNTAAPGLTLPGAANATARLAAARRLLAHRPLAGEVRRALFGAGDSGVRGRRAGPRVAFDVSIILLYLSDVVGPNSACKQMVERARGVGASTANFVVTGMYADDNDDWRVDSLGFAESAANKAYRQYTPDVTARFEQGLLECMRHAVARGMRLAVHPHLDDGLGKSTWRNGMVFDPQEALGPGPSFYEAILRPAANAVANANTRGEPVYFALQAEMGASLFTYPGSYQALMKQLQAIMGGKAKFGVALNWEKVCGCPRQLLYSTDYAQALQANWRKVQAQVDMAAVQKLFRALDWIGFSAYAPLPVRLREPKALERSLMLASTELAKFGVHLSQLLAAGKELVVSEFGLGGGERDDGSRRAAQPAQVAANPYWGVSGAYTKARDPWALSPNREYLRRFYRVAAEWLAQGGSPAFPVSHLFIWAISSYDVLGIHYQSSTQDGTYRDPVVAELVKTHNTRPQN